MLHQINAFISLFLMAALGVDKVQSCSHNFEPWYDGVCSREFEQPAQYSDATLQCRNFEATLPILYTKEENAKLLEHIQCTNGIGMNPHCLGVVLGLSCSTKFPKKFVWDDGKGDNPIDEANLHFRHPTNCTSFSRYAMSTTDGTWFTQFLDIELHVVCQQPNDIASPCRNAHTAPVIGMGDKCYYVSPSASWSQAERDCKRDFGDLISIHVKEQNDFVLGLVNSSVSSVAIGLRAVEPLCPAAGSTTTAYAWTDGTPLDFNHADPGSKCIQGKECMAMVSKATAVNRGKWENVDCTTDAIPSVCVRNALSISNPKPDQCRDLDFKVGDEIFSPNFPVSHGEMHCIYTVTAKADQKALIRPVFFEANTCCDSLTIHDPQNGNLQVWTGIHAESSFEFTDTTITLTWNATSGINVAGFHLVVEDESNVPTQPTEAPPISEATAPSSQKPTGSPPNSAATAPTNTPPPTTLPPPPVGFYPCPCEHSSIWLDIVFVVDSSTAVGALGIVDVTGSIQSALNKMSVGSDKFQTQVGIVAYAATPQVVYKLGTVNSQADVDNLTIPYLKAEGSNLTGALKMAKQEVLEKSTRSARQVIVVIAGSFGDDVEDNAIFIANIIKGTGTLIITVDHVSKEHNPIPDLGKLATPTYAFSVWDGSYKTDNVLQAYCDANCACPPGLTIYEIEGYPNPRKLPYGGCYSVSTSAITHRQAALSCKKEVGFLPGIHSDDKQQFMMSLLPSKTKYWLGYSNASGSWVWDDGITVPYANWGSGEPNAANGQCAYAWQYSGFRTEWRTSDCTSPSSSYAYACEIVPCSSTNFCDYSL